MSNLFYSSMFSVLSQWSDFKVSKHLYKSYFDLQKKNSSSSSKTDEAEKDKNKDTVDKSKLKNYTTDKLGSVTSGVTAAYSKVKAAFEVKEGKEFDKDAAYNAAYSFVNSYNDMMSLAGNSGNATVTGKMDFIRSMTDSRQSVLADAGITINDDGTLNLDMKTFMDASENQLRAVFTETNSFGNFVDNTASSLNKFANSSYYKSLTGTPSASSTANSSSNASSASSSSESKKTESSKEQDSKTNPLYDKFGKPSASTTTTTPGTAKEILDYIV